MYNSVNWSVVIIYVNEGFFIISIINGAIKWSDIGFNYPPYLFIRNLIY